MSAAPKKWLGDGVLAATLLTATTLLLLWGPEQMTRRAQQALGWQADEGYIEAAQRQSAAAREISAPQRALLQTIERQNVKKTLTHFATQKSRVPGYPGFDHAANYVRSTFTGLGLAGVTADTFEVTVPLDRGAELTLAGTGERIALYSLWPNHVRPPTTPHAGLSGPLLDGGQGLLADFNGKVVDGGIVLLGFGCGMDYINARALGARAILFYDDGQVTREQARDKFLKVPVDVPRFWIGRPDSERLRQRLKSEQIAATVRGRMEWETVPAYNILGYLPGLDEPMPGRAGRRWKDELIIISAHYDAMSVVPALAPGAESASGITALLHLAELLVQQQPRYSVLFLATGAHFEGLEGINQFLYRHARKSTYFRQRIQDPIDFRLFIGLDLSSRNDQVATFAQGTFYSGWKTNKYLKNLMAPYARRFADYVENTFAPERRPRYVDAIAPSQQAWKDFMPVGLALDSEAPIFMGLTGLSLVTPDDARRRVDTPLDNLEYVDFAALTRQIRTIGAIVLGAVDDADLFGESALELQDKGHSLAGNIYWFNRDLHFAVPQDPLAGALVTYQQPGPQSVAGVRTLMVTQTDSSGRFRYDILRNSNTNRVLAYKLGAAGEIIWAPDLGEEGDAAFPISQKYVWWEDEMVQVLFACRSLNLFEIVDARQLVALGELNVLAQNDAPPQWYGKDYIAKQNLLEGKVALAAAVYARAGTRVKMLMGTDLLGIKYLLTNAPAELLQEPIEVAQATPELLQRAKGQGYAIESGLIRHPLYRSAADMWVIDDVRMKILERYGVRNERVAQLHEEARLALQQAQAALAALRYDDFAAAVRRAAGLESRAYPDVKATASDTVNGIVFYFILLLPFSFFAERLLFGFADIRRQLAAATGIFLLVFLALHQVHPAFKLSSSPYIILLGFVILVMGTAVIALVVGKFKGEMQQTRRQETGVYEVDVGRLSAALAAVLLGISNLRKRKVRTSLTTITLTLVCFTALSFTSVTTSIQFYRMPRSGAAPYEGALVRDPNWKGLQATVFDYVHSAFGARAQVAPRAWYLLPQPKGRSHIHFVVPASGKASNAYGVVGLSAAEPRVMGIDQRLKAGGRWFAPGERDVCILPDDLAALVGIGPQDVGQAHIRVLGHDYVVIGLIDAEAFNQMRDLDGEKLTPVDMVSETTVQNTSSQNPEIVPTAPIRSYDHLQSSNVVLLPYAEVLEMGGALRSIAIVDFEGDLLAAIEAFATRVALPTFAGHAGAVTVYSSLGVASIGGLGNLAIPLLIAALIVLNTMMGAVYERVSEIGIYSSLGLTPLHVAALFLAEASVFSTIGAVLGYLLGQSLALVLAQFGMLEGMVLNYSSLSAVSATLIVMLTVFISTIYPAKKAADMTVPDVTRKWSFGEPQGDEWIFDFPFTVPGAEIEGFYAYLHQIFASYGEGSVGKFLTQDLEIDRTAAGSEPRYRIAMQAWLAPYDLGISQDVLMDAVPTGQHHIYRIVMQLQRRSGDVVTWKRLNHGFLQVLRQRFLIWRTTPPQVKEDFAARAQALLALGEELS